MQITQSFIEQVVEAVKSCKAIMTGAFTVMQKGNASNLVTTADTAVQAQLKALLKAILPSAVFWGRNRRKRRRSARVIGWSIPSTGLLILRAGCA